MLFSWDLSIQGAKEALCLEIPLRTIKCRNLGFPSSDWKKKNCRIWHLIVIKIILKGNKWKWSKPGESCSSLQYLSSSHCPQVRSSIVLIPPLVGVSSWAPRQTDLFLFVQIFRYRSPWNVASEESLSFSTEEINSDYMFSVADT